MTKVTTERAKASNPKSLSGLLPFLKPYRGRMGLALCFLVLAAAATLAFPLALRSLIDGGLMQADKGEQLMALREHFALLSGLGSPTERPPIAIPSKPC